MFKQINHSFAAKLNIYLISSAFLLWGIGFCLFYHYSSRAIEHQAYLKIDESAEKINLKVTRLLRTIERSLKISAGLSLPMLLMPIRFMRLPGRSF